MKFTVTSVAVLSIALSMFSCKKDSITEPQALVSNASAVTANSANTATFSAYDNSYTVGTGSGDLVIDGSSYSITNSYLVKIKSGTYSTITIKNIAAALSTPLTIKNDGAVIITGSMQTSNLSNVVISGDNTPGITYGFAFKNIGYRAIVMDSKISGVTLKSMSFQNVTDYSISGTSNNSSGLTYTGTSATRSEGLKVLSCLFDNAGMISFGGNLNGDTGEDTGLFKDIEIGGNTFQNTNTGSVCSFTNVQDYNIHDNIVNNINQTNDNHNGVFFMQGNGSFHDNKLTNYQGNSIRMWLYSRGNGPATVSIYNNLCYNTRKYGAFELQVFDRNIVKGKTTYANALVYNNTAGQLNTSKQWEGQMLDLYNTHGNVQYYNNLGFNLVSVTGKITDMINNMGDAKITRETNNSYSPTQQEAVSNLVTFTSLIAGVGDILKL